MSRIDLFIIPHYRSDHRPLLVTPKSLGASSRRPFCFQKMWLLHQNFSTVINSTWFLEVKGNMIIKVRLKLKRFKLAIQK